MRLTDIWGRKWMAQGGLLLFLLTLSLYFIKISTEIIYATLFLMGLGSPLTVVIPYLLLMESVSPDYRSFTCFVIFLFGSISNVYLPLIHEFGKDWWIVFWIEFGLALSAFLGFLFFVRESPKFYIGAKKFDKARQVYSYIAKVNKKPMFINKFEGEQMLQESVVSQQGSSGIRDIFIIPSLRVPLFVVPLAWFAVSFI